jgi:ABC-2 type transport system permease protein
MSGAVRWDFTDVGPTSPTQLAALTRRNVIKTYRDPQLLMFSSLMPFAMLILFSQVFRSIQSGPGFPTGVAYIDYLAPAMLAVSTVMGATNSGVSVASDIGSGMVDRFKAMPVARWTPLVARALTDELLTVIRAVVLGVGAAAILGFRLHGSIHETVAGVAVLLPLSFAMSWVFIAIGARLERTDLVQMAGMMVMMPFMFISSAFAPLETMPRWLGVIARMNPVTHTTDAVRGYVLGTPDADAVFRSLLSSGVLLGLAIGATFALTRDAER